MIEALIIVGMLITGLLIATREPDEIDEPDAGCYECIDKQDLINRRKQLEDE